MSLLLVNQPLPFIRQAKSGQSSLPSNAVAPLPPLTTDTVEITLAGVNTVPFNASNRSGRATTLKLPLTPQILNLVSQPARFLHHHGYSQLANIELTGFFGRLLNKHLQEAKAVHSFDKTMLLLDAIQQRVQVQMSRRGEHKEAPFFTVTADLTLLGALRKEGWSSVNQQILEKTENLKWTNFLRTLGQSGLVPSIQDALVIPYLPIKKDNLTLQQRYLNSLLLREYETKQD